MRAVNLIPAEARPGGGGAYGRSEGAAYVLTGLVAGLALMVFLYVTAQHQIADRQGTTARLNAEAQAATAQAAALAPYTGFIALRNARLNAVEQLAGVRFDWAHAYHELGRVLPLDVALQSVTGTIGGASATASAPATPTPAPGAAGATGATGAAGAASSAAVTAAQSATPPGSIPTITLAGCTTTQAEVAKTIGRLQLIDGVTDVQLSSATKKSASGAASASAAGMSTSAPCPVNFSLKVDFAALPPVTVTSGTVGSGTPESAVATGAASNLATSTGATGATGSSGATGATGSAAAHPSTSTPSTPSTTAPAR